MKFKVLSTLAGLFAGALLVCATPARADDSLTSILAKKSIALGVASDFPPYGYMGPDFKLTGVDDQELCRSGRQDHCGNARHDSGRYIAADGATDTQDHAF